MRVKQVAKSKAAAEVKALQEYLDQAFANVSGGWLSRVNTIRSHLNNILNTLEGRS